MYRQHRTDDPQGSSRREFLGRSLAVAAVGALAGNLSIARGAHAAGDDLIKIALIGCGGRGTGACKNALLTKGPVKLVAMADVFADRIQRSLKTLLADEEIGKDRIDVPPGRRFRGFDAYQEAIGCGVDLVLLTTPPGFRPFQYAAAVKAGKHIFMEKPCCVDGPGFRALVAANDEAKKKRLSVVVGLQRHHQSNYIEGIKRIRDGAVGQIQFIRTYFNMPGGGPNDSRKPQQMTEMEYQIRRWGMFTWLSGDHIVEQAVHEIDVANWIMDAEPVKANGMGGRQVRIGRGNGQIFDHHFVEYEFAGGARHFCQARQIAGCWSHVSDNAHGTKRTLTLGSGPYGMGGPADYSGGEGRAEKQKKVRNPYQQEHDDLFASVRRGEMLFEGDYAATSSMTAVMGRMATYSGKVVTWEEAANSQLSLAPERYALDAMPPAVPGQDGNYPVAVPGLTKAW